MPTRNTGILSEIITVLGDLVPMPAKALKRLEKHYKDQLLVNAGSTAFILESAEQLRLAIIPPEAAQVLNHIGEQAQLGITVDQVDEAINHLYPDRFIEP